MLRKELLLTLLFIASACERTRSSPRSEISEESSRGGPALSGKVVYRPLGASPGGYQNIQEAQWPDRCVKGSVTRSNGPLFPFNENQTLVVRGPLVLSDLAVYQKKTGAAAWTKISDLTSLVWKENSYGAIKEIGSYPTRNKTLENGREIFAQLPEAGELVLVMKAKMPRATGPVYSAVAQDDVPAVWMLNSKVFQAPSAQYFCNCRGQGGAGGCGELDIAEIIPEDKEGVTTTLYSYEGARGAKLSARPVDRFQIYAAILRIASGTGEVSVGEADFFDFTRSELSDVFVSHDWLASARLLNPGAESLNPVP